MSQIWQIETAKPQRVRSCAEPTEIESKLHFGFLECSSVIKLGESRPQSPRLASIKPPRAHVIYLLPIWINWPVRWIRRSVRIYVFPTSSPPPCCCWVIVTVPMDNWRTVNSIVVQSKGEMVMKLNYCSKRIHHLVLLDRGCGGICEPNWGQQLSTCVSPANTNKCLGADLYGKSFIEFNTYFTF